MKKKFSTYIFSIALVVLVSGSISAQEVAEADPAAAAQSNNLTYDANKELADNNFISAEVEYRRAISKSDQNSVARYNLGNAYYNNESYSEAFGRFKQAGEISADKPDKHKAYHNMGNVFMKNKDYAKAVEAYKEALRNNPNDEETRNNLALAKEMMKKKQDEQQNDDQQDQNDQNDQNQDQQNQDQNEGAEEENQNQGEEGEDKDEQKEDGREDEGDEEEKEDQEPKESEQQQPQQKPRPNQLSPEQIENLLEAMENEERKVQEKMDAKKVKGMKIKNEKDW